MMQSTWHSPSALAHVYLHAHRLTCMYLHRGNCTEGPTRIHSHINACTHTHTYTHVHIPSCVSLHIGIHMHIPANKNLYTPVPIHVYLHTHVLKNIYIMPYQTQSSLKTQLGFTNTIYLYNFAKWALINSEVTFLCSDPISAMHGHGDQNAHNFHMCSTPFGQFPFYSLKCRRLTDFQNKLQFLTFSHNLALVTKGRCLCGAAL